MSHTDPQQLDAEALYASLLEQVKAGIAGANDPAIVGIHSGGAWIAERLAKDLAWRRAWACWMCPSTATITRRRACRPK